VRGGVDGERLVFTTELLIDDRRRSVSLVTVQFSPQAGATLVTYTEQYAFLDVVGDGSAEIAEREGGTRLLLSRLRAAVTAWGNVSRKEGVLSHGRPYLADPNRRDTR
jgi:hypothetical protein